MRSDRPDKETKCHRTGFTMTCHEGVNTHGCRLWKRVTLEGNPEAAAGSLVQPVDHYDCADSLIDLYLKDMLRRQLQTTATVDKTTVEVVKAVDTLRKEVHEANDVQMVGAIARINRDLEERRAFAIDNVAPAQKLLE